jgi:hypothetical protein
MDTPLLPGSNLLWTAAPFQQSSTTVPFHHSLPYRTNLDAPVVFLITPRYDPRRQHRSFLYEYPFASGTCLPSRSLTVVVYSFLLTICCLATDVVPLSVSRPLPRNECCFRAVRKQRLFLCLHSSCFEQICHNTICYVDLPVLVMSEVCFTQALHFRESQGKIIELRNMSGTETQSQQGSIKLLFSCRGREPTLPYYTPRRRKAES